MRYEDLIILIPSHSLEDFPTELSEEDAASLLNAFAVAWHPQLIASAGVLPRWNRADDPPEGPTRRLVFVPTHCDSWVPAGWVERVLAEGAVVVRGTSDRQQMIERAVLPLEDHRVVSPDLVADFLALGSCYLQIELLTRKMRHFSNLDEVYLQREAVAAAEAALAGDAETARNKLRGCFETLTEARQRFYGVDCYLIDLCLLSPTTPADDITRLLRDGVPTNWLSNAQELEELARSAPVWLEKLRENCTAGQAEVICGCWGEPPLPVWPLGSQLWHLAQARAICEQIVGRAPVTWATRRFGLAPTWPLLLKRAGFTGALHVALDDGIYPDFEYSKFRWEGIDNSVIESWSRIPLAGDTATSFLRFADRMSESMDNDQTAALAFARWPDLRTPFLNDFRRIHTYSPVLGKFATFAEFFERTEFPSRSGSYRPREYLSPFFVQQVAREEVDPLSRCLRQWQHRLQFDHSRWCSHLADTLRGRKGTPPFQPDLERDLETLPETATVEQRESFEARLQATLAQAARQLAELVLGDAGGRTGYLLINPHGFKRTVGLQLPHDAPTPLANATTRVQSLPDRTVFTAELPGCGFAWLPAVAAPGANTAKVGEAAVDKRGAAAKSVALGDHPNTPLAEPDMLRNEFFEMRLNPQTGGMLQLKNYGRSPNRLSQQLSYRFARERTFMVGEGDAAEEFRSHYAEMRGHSSRVTSGGPVLGEIVTTGEIYDQKNQHQLAGFQQTFRIWRGRPILEILIELDVLRQPEHEAWQSYYAARFAWHDSSASLARSVLVTTHETAEERLESPLFLEIAAGEMRTTILPCGLPYHRKSGPRMLDTILVSAGETQRHFRLVIALDQQFPQVAAWDAFSPPLVVPFPEPAVDHKDEPAPRVATSMASDAPRQGWFFHVDARAVQILDLLPLLPEPQPTFGTWHRPEEPPAETPAGCAVRLQETEGRPTQFRLRAFRTPVRARQRDFLGKTLAELPIEGDSVILSLGSYELAEIELLFG